VNSRYSYHEWRDEDGAHHKMAVHRWVWEQANGPLPKGWVVHHLDGNTKNNALSNLQSMSKQEHTKIHKRFSVYNKERLGKTNEEYFGPEKAKEIHDKQSEKMKGRVYTEERNRRVSEGLKGHGVSDETRAKMAASAKARWAKATEAMNRWNNK
jgi:hypothetical protein